MDELNIETFLANDDLRIASVWKERIIEELKDCDLIIPILSKDFQKSDWCSQELGIFYIQNKKIIPISFDETKPYGFYNHIQSRLIKNMPIELIISEGLMECNNNFNGFINLLKKRLSFRWAETIFNTLEPYFDKIEKDDLNALIDISIRDGQIWSASECFNKYIPKLLEKRCNDIIPEYFKKIKYQIENQEWYKK